MKNWFILYCSQYNPIKWLSLEQKWKLLEKLFTYNNWENYEANDWIVDMAFGFFRQQFEMDNKKYEETIVKRNQQNGLKWGRPRKEKEETESEEKNPKNPVGLKKPDNDNDKDKDNDKDNKKENKEKINFSFEIEKQKEVLDWVEIDENLKKSLLTFLEFRKQIKKPLKEISFMAFLKSLQKLSWWDTNNAVAILEQSIANGWQWIFELKNNTNKQKIWTEKL